MNLEEIKAKEECGEGLTVEEIKFLRENVKPIKHVYGKYGTLAKIYLEENRWEKVAALGKDYPEYLHGIDRQADEIYETMYAKLSKDERYKRTGNFMEDLHRESEIKQLIEEEILNELVYV
ncbi:MAG: TnpV protein [Clostridia bacterium]|nr:TnpV protein [Clostridia bacterium]